MNKTRVESWRNRLNQMILVLPGQWFGLMVIYWARFYPAFKPLGFNHAFPPPLAFFAGCLLSCLPFLLPQSYFIPRGFECGRLYPALGVRWFRFLATDGILANRVLKRIDPNYRVVHDRATLRAHIQGTYPNERWHSAFFIAGTLTAAHAAWTKQYVFCALIGVTNIAFNLYPVFHQRYKRARARRALRHFSSVEEERVG
jgi:hypothetical protein